MWFKKNYPRDFLLQFTSELALLYQSGITLSQALNLLAQEQKNERALTLIAGVERQILKGKSLYLSLKRYPDIFPKFYLKLIDLGEHSGRLQDILSNLANNLEQQRQLKRKITNAMFYPVTTLIVNLSVVMGLLWFVVPQYSNFFDKNKNALPLLTQALMGLSAELHQYFLINLIGIILASIALNYTLKQKRYRKKFTQSCTNLIYIKTLISIRDWAALCRNLSLCLQAGLSLTQALNLCQTLSNNPKWQQMLVSIINDINKGKNFFNALKRHQVPGLILQFIKIGEDTGRLEQQLLKLAIIYEQRLSDSLNKLTHLIEPLMMIILGACVGLIMYALYEPLIQMGNFI